MQHAAGGYEFSTQRLDSGSNQAICVAIKMCCTAHGDHLGIFPPLGRDRWARCKTGSSFPFFDGVAMHPFSIIVVMTRCNPCTAFQALCIFVSYAVTIGCLVLLS